MWERYPDTYQKINRVEAIIRENLKSRNKPMEGLLVNLSNAGGKRLRPAFTILSAGFGEFDDDKVLFAAAGIEILHMATLVHDDIIDDAEMRRGAPTVNRQYGDKMAVYMGDFLLTRAVMLLTGVLPKERLEQIARGIKSVCEAEVEQFYSRFHPEVTLVTYLKRIGRKTAALFSFSCEEGAALSHCKKNHRRNLVKFGFYYGMAFQIQDDIVNLTEGMDKTGKPKGNDIREGVITLPFILALRKSQEFSKKVEDIFSNKSISQGDIDWIIREIIRLGGVREARHWVERYLKRAQKMLKPLPDLDEKQFFWDLTLQMKATN